MTSWYTKGSGHPSPRTARPAPAIDRREALGLIGAGIAMPVRAAIPGAPGLGEIAADRGIAFGAAVASRHLVPGSPLATALVAECRTVVAEFEMKWHAIEPAWGTRHLGGADRIAAFASRNGQVLRGHTLLWPSAKRLPPWIEAWPESDTGGLQAAVDDHITGLARRYRGQVSSWDVVNEALEARDGRTDALRRSVLLDRLGEGYIDRAFQAARAADPAARLIYNDYGVEHAIPWQVAKRGHLLGLLDRLRGRSVPVDGVGIQAHLRAGDPFDEAGFGRFLDEVADMGLMIEITELDVEDRSLQGDVAQRDQACADLVRRFLDVSLSRRAVKAVLTWGLSDQASWLNEPRWGKGRADGLALRPLPLDAWLARKPMWHAMAAAFAAAPAR